MIAAARILLLIAQSWAVCLFVVPFCYGALLVYLQAVMFRINPRTYGSNAEDPAGAVLGVMWGLILLCTSRGAGAILRVPRPDPLRRAAEGCIAAVGGYAAGWAVAFALMPPLLAKLNQLDPRWPYPGEGYIDCRDYGANLGGLLGAVLMACVVQAAARRNNRRTDTRDA